MAKIVHDTAGWEYELRDADELRQRDAEAFFKARREFGGDDRVSSPEHNGIVVRAAAKCGWVDGLDPAAVDGLHPAETTWLASEIQDMLAAAFEVPGE